MSAQEDPKLLLAELESARLAMQARGNASRRSRLLLGVLILLLLLGGLTLWLLATMADRLAPGKPGSSAVSTQIQPVSFREGKSENLLCAEPDSSLKWSLHPTSPYSCSGMAANAGALPKALFALLSPD